MQKLAHFLPRPQVHLANYQLEVVSNDPVYNTLRERAAKANRIV